MIQREIPRSFLPFLLLFLPALLPLSPLLFWSFPTFLLFFPLLADFFLFLSLCVSSLLASFPAGLSLLPITSCVPFPPSLLFPFFTASLPLTLPSLLRQVLRHDPSPLPAGRRPALMLHAPAGCHGDLPGDGDAGDAR